MPTKPSESRSKTAQALEELLLQVAEDLQVQQEEIRRKFPRMTSLPPPLQIDPDLIRSFVGSHTYRQAVDDYLQERTGEHLLTTVLRLLVALVPTIVGR